MKHVLTQLIDLQAIKIGDPLDDSSRMGPLINADQYKKVLGYIQVLHSAALARTPGPAPNPSLE